MLLGLMLKSLADFPVMACKRPGRVAAVQGVVGVAAHIVGGDKAGPVGLGVSLLGQGHPQHAVGRVVVHGAAGGQFRVHGDVLGRAGVVEEADRVEADRRDPFSTVVPS